MAAESEKVGITLSKKAIEQYSKVAEWKGLTLAGLLRQILEREHESPAFCNLFKRASENQ